MTTQTIDKLVEFSKHIKKRFPVVLTEKEALNLAVQMWKADSLDTIAEALKVDGDISQSLSEISKAIKNEL